MQRLAVRGETRELIEAGVSDDAWARRERRQYEASRRADGDHDYHYPARYLGREAADQPAPTRASPSTRSSKANVCGSAQANSQRSSRRSKPTATGCW